jgi:CBS domain-containing protein
MRDQEEKIIGLITETDIIRKVVDQERSLTINTVDAAMRPILGLPLRLLEDAFHMMKDSGVRHLLVKQNHVVVSLFSLSGLLANL